MGVLVTEGLLNDVWSGTMQSFRCDNEFCCSEVVVRDVGIGVDGEMRVRLVRG